MDSCVICRDLERAYKAGLSEYIEARSSTYYRICTELAAQKNVDMERSRDDLEEHQFACVSVVQRQATFGPHPRNSAVVQETEAAVAAS